MQIKQVDCIQSHLVFHSFIILIRKQPILDFLIPSVLQYLQVQSTKLKSKPSMMNRGKFWIGTHHEADAVVVDTGLEPVSSCTRRDSASGNHFMSE